MVMVIPVAIIIVVAGIIIGTVMIMMMMVVMMVIVEMVWFRIGNGIVPEERIGTRAVFSSDANFSFLPGAR